MPAENYFQLTDQELYSRLTTSKEGLTEAEAKKRVDQFGENKLSAKKKISALQLFLSQFKNSLILILIGSSILIFFVYFFGGKKDSYDLIEGSLILSIILLITLLGFFQEYKAEKSIAALKKLLAFKAKVMRDGTELEIDVADLVPGDIVILEEGDKVPADIRLIQVATLASLESSLTGESVAIHKEVEVLEGNLQLADQKNMVFSGTIITQGRGLGVVVRTGDNTEIGKIATSVSEIREQETPIQKRLNEIGKMIGLITLAICGFVFIFIVFFAGETLHLPLFDRIIKSFISAVALAVAAIPEGLPAVVTISLALGTQRMIKRKALVRKLNSVETLGSTDVICTDKTGTLTKGEMTVTEAYFDNQVFILTGIGYEKNGVVTLDGKEVDVSKNPLFAAGGYCNNASFKDGKVIGDPTEEALLISAAKAGVENEIERIKETPFSSERKMMSVLIKKEKEYFVYSKGAPEVILEKCSHIVKNNKEIILSSADRKDILKQAEAMNMKALRTLGFAYKSIGKEINLEKDEKGLEERLVFLGLQGMIDPPRVEVKPLIVQCNVSGIRVIMITGDHELTAAAVAADIGILGGSLSGEELDQLTQIEFEEAVKSVNIYARVSPNFKMRIVEILQRQGHIVAMTGDGVNDAPAVKKANIGIAMGITGTDVAKESSDMVLLDDNFSTIVNAIEEGRGIFDNIRKFVNYLLSCNIAEVLVVFFALVIFQHQPLTATMLLWINVITDGLPAVALGLDPAEKDIMSYSPKKFQGHVISKRLWIEMIIFGVMLTIGVLGIYEYNIIVKGPEQASAAAFIAVVIFELVRLLFIRSDYKTSLFSNKWLLTAVAFSLVMQVALVYIPFTATLFRVSSIDLVDWVYIVVVSVILWYGFRFIRKLLDHFPYFSTN